MAVMVVGSVMVMRVKGSVGDCDMICCVSEVMVVLVNIAKGDDR